MRCEFPSFASLHDLIDCETASKMKESIIYPGEYVLSPEAQKLVDDIKSAHSIKVTTLQINMAELEGYFIIEASIPGKRREDIFIYTRDNILSLIVLNAGVQKEMHEKVQVHEFETNCLERHIILPVNVDLEFIRAEYAQGILRIHIPKTPEIPLHVDTQVVVY